MKKSILISACIIVVGILLAIFVPNNLPDNTRLDADISISDTATKPPVSTVPTVPEEPSVPATRPSEVVTPPTTGPEYTEPTVPETTVPDNDEVTEEEVPEVEVPSVESVPITGNADVLSSNTEVKNSANEDNANPDASYNKVHVEESVNLPTPAISATEEEVVVNDTTTDDTQDNEVREDTSSEVYLSPAPEDDKVVFEAEEVPEDQFVFDFDDLF